MCVYVCMCVCMYVYYVHPEVGVGIGIGGLPFSFGKGSGGRFRGSRKAAPREQGSVRGRRVLQIGEMVISAFRGLIGLGPASRVFR